jgi:hypothetical protein
VSYQTLLAEVRKAFAAEVEVAPSITLRGGNAIDEYSPPPPFEPDVDAVTDKYLETYPWGVSYLDANSWKHYLPSLFEYALRHVDSGSLVIEALLNSLRPPDRDPPRLASLSIEQEALVTQFLDVLAFSKESANQELACQVLEEWWAPGALYRVLQT